MRSIRRNRIDLPLLPNTTVERGDILTVVGPQQRVTAVAAILGYADRATTATDMVFVGLGVVIGSLIGCRPSWWETCN